LKTFIFQKKKRKGKPIEFDTKFHLRCEINGGIVKKILQNYKSVDEILPSIQDFLSSFVAVDEVQTKQNSDNQTSVSSLASINTQAMPSIDSSHGWKRCNSGHPTGSKEEVSCQAGLTPWKSENKIC
jgi:hypothetical protein